MSQVETGSAYHRRTFHVTFERISFDLIKITIGGPAVSMEYLADSSEP